MEIGGPTWDGILGAVGAVLGGALGAGGAALGVFWQLRASRRRRETEVSSFRKGVSDELMARAAELIVVRTAIDARVCLAIRDAGTMIRREENAIRSFVRSFTGTALAIDGGITL